MQHLAHEEPIKINMGSFDLAHRLFLTENFLSLSLSPLQVRSSLFEMARKTKFDLCRHVLVTFVLLVIINLLVIFIPSMKDIFGVVGVTSANMLIFILPSSLYLKITQQDGSKLTQRIWASLFLALGVLFSLVSIPLVIYDWVQSGSSAEGH